MRFSIILRLVLLLVLLVASTVCSVLFVNAGYYVVVGLCATIALVSLIFIVRYFTSTLRKVTFMFNSVENNDFTFRFSQNSRVSSDRMLNTALNRIKDIIHKTKLEIAERERYYEKILDHSATGIMVVDPQTGIVYQTNTATENIFAIGQITHINQLSVISDEVSQTLRNINYGESKTIAFDNEMNEVSLVLWASAINLHDRELKLISISDASSAMESAEVENWVRLSRVLTHEIMNSLAPITSLSEQLRATTDRDTLNCGLEVISTTGRSLISFVDNYRRLTRIPTPVMSDFDLMSLLSIQSSLIDAPVDLTAVNENIRLYADENLIGQVVLNLLRNAQHATVSGGRIFVRASRDLAGRVVVEICNSGELIDPAIRDNIFVPFFTTKSGGSGIGLSLSRQIMRLHGGAIHCVSQVQAGGNFTSFSLRF